MGPGSSPQVATTVGRMNDPTTASLTRAFDPGHPHLEMKAQRQTYELWTQPKNVYVGTFRGREGADFVLPLKLRDFSERRALAEMTGERDRRPRPDQLDSSDAQSAFRPLPPTSPVLTGAASTDKALFGDGAAPVLPKRSGRSPRTRSLACRQFAAAAFERWGSCRLIARSGGGPVRAQNRCPTPES